MGSFSPTHWVILLIVVLLVFGTKKLRGAGKDLGGAVKEFKDAVKDEPNMLSKEDDEVVETTASEKNKENV